jgi:GNAT superfamily N-acetyltransferase
MSATIRNIGAEEWPLRRDLRLLALAEAPEAFRATLDEEQRQSDSWWADLIGRTADHPRGGLWVAENDGEAVGMLFARLSPDQDLPSVGAMWVAPQSRRLGIGQDLLDAALEWARGKGAEIAEQWVTDGNSSAESFYRQTGFQPTTDTQPLRDNSSLTARRYTSQL